MKKSFRFPIILIAVFGISIAAHEKAGDGKYFEISKNIEIFTNLYKELNTNYVNELDPSKLMRTGVEAMLTSLDPYTNYISESDIEGYRFITEGKYNGVGASFDKTGDEVLVTEIFEKSPAQKGGLKAGDRIIAVDGKNAKGKSVEEVGDALKGAGGSSVELTVSRMQTDGNFKTIRVKLNRDEITEQNVPYSGLVGEHVGYIVLTTFTREAGDNVRKAFLDLRAKDPQLKGVILDLRNNGGGLLNEAVNICNIWLPKDQLVVATKGKVIEWDRSFKTLNPSDDEQMPLTVLVNKGSASASEIVSGTLQDCDRAVIMGQRSYGKGLVQNIYDIGYNSKLKITTAKYYTPSGRCIQAVKYENGKHVDIPDTLRAAFKTKAGRSVLDGGGIKPDVLLSRSDDFGLMHALKEKFVLLDFVTKYSLTHDSASVGAPENFHYTDFDAFMGFLSTHNFQYESESEKYLKKLREEIVKEKSDETLAPEITALENKIKSEKKNDLMRHKNAILHEIEKLIVARYFFERGTIQTNLRNDDEIKSAVALFNDATRYKSILKQ